MTNHQGRDPEIETMNFEQMSLQDSASLEVDRNVVVARQDEHCVLLDYERGEYYGLNDSATRIWELLSEHVPLPTIVQRIVDEYEVTEETAREDLAGLLRNLANRGLVRVRR